MDNSIEYARHLEIMRQELLAPSVRYQNILKISKDGDQYCVLLGKNLQEGIAGFGSTMRSAMNEFDAAFDLDEIPSLLSESPSNP